MNPLIAQSSYVVFESALLLYLPAFFAGLLILIIFWVAALVVAGTIIRVGQAREVEATVLSFVSKSVKYTILAFGIITVLGTWGINVTALVGGLGLTGFALGFALKDVISNVLSGILLLLYRPFVPGDKIQVSGHEGTVIDIDLRYTELETGDTHILIPNSSLFTNAVVIFDKRKHTSGEVGKI